jgi:hypothetical protein
MGSAVRLLLLCICIALALGDQTGPLIRPTQLLVATIVDTANKEIVRDALMLFRSISLFGGEFKHATFLVGVTSNDDCALLDGALLQSLYSLGLNLEIIYLPQTREIAKTLNKVWVMVISFAGISLYSDNPILLYSYSELIYSYNPTLLYSYSIPPPPHTHTHTHSSKCSATSTAPDSTISCGWMQT